MALTGEEEAYLNSIYWDPAHPGSFSGEDKLYRVIKNEGRFRITHKKLKKWLSSQEIYSVHRQARRHYSRRPVIVSAPGKQADADLMDMVSLAEYNQDVKFILLYIDDFSRYIWTFPLKSKTGAEVVKGFKQIYQDGGKCEKLRTDKGTEFLNKPLQLFLKKEKVHHFVSQNPSTKASIAERAIKTIKMKLYKYMNQFQTFNYLPALSKITAAYNNTYHRSIKMAPSQVSSENQSQVWATLHKRKESPYRPENAKIKVGDWVRVSFLNKVFDREYSERWTREVFQVVAASLKQGRAAYQLQDYAGDPISGTFYPEELQVVSDPKNAVYKIEKVIRTRKLKNRPKEFLIKWVGWNSKFNSWVTEEDLREIPKPPE